MAKAIPMDLVSPTQAALILRVNIATIYKWIEKRRITRYGETRSARVSLAECANPRKPRYIYWRKPKRQWTPDLYSTDADRVGL